MDNIQYYAPVIIPTLCRYKHFKQCIESLMRCTHAIKTDVFIGLDYPAKDEHWSGYRKILNYLNTIEEQSCFKSLNIIRRERNYGLGKNGNSAMLIKEILKKYDAYIFSEDDNIFSPAFLDFINRGLQLYKDNKQILAINGYSFYFNFRCAEDDTVYFGNYTFSGWGYGIWKDRRIKLDTLSSKWLRSKGIIKSCLMIAKNYGWERTLRYVSALNIPDNKFRITDYMIASYMILDKKYVIIPRISLVRNIGIDGSGENFENVSDINKNKYSRQLIYEGTEYSIVKNGPDYFKINNKVYEENSLDKISFFKFLTILSKAILCKVGKIIKHLINNIGK